jgi:hypothetical protein
VIHPSQAAKMRNRSVGHNRRTRAYSSWTQDITPMCPYIAASVELHDPQHPRIPVRARLQEGHRRAARRNRPRGRRRQPRTARRATRPAPRRRLGPHPGPQRRILPDRRRHRRRPHRQRHPRDSPGECKYNSRVARGETPSGYPAQDGQVQPGTARRAAQRRVLHRGPRQAGTRHRHSPSVAVRETADGYTNRPTGMKPVRHASVAPRTQRHPPVQGGTPRHTDETAR